MDFDDALYKDIILEHYKSKKYKRRLENAHAHAEGANPLCGDDIELFVRFEGERIAEVTYDGIGCSICLASADMLCEAIEGKTLDEAKDLIARFKGMLLEEAEPDFPDELSDLEAMEGVKQYPVRIKCANLSWTTLEQMLSETKETE